MAKPPELPDITECKSKLQRVPQRSPEAIAQDHERQVEAKRNLDRALQSYLATVRCEGDINSGRLVEIWSEYAIDLYDSLGESFEDVPLNHEIAFGQNGMLAGGQTLDQVKRDLIGFSVPRPEHWAHPKEQG